MPVAADSQLRLEPSLERARERSVRSSAESASWVTGKGSPGAGGASLRIEAEPSTSR